MQLCSQAALCRLAREVSEDAPSVLSEDVFEEDNINRGVTLFFSPGMIYVSTEQDVSITNIQTKFSKSAMTTYFFCIVFWHGTLTFEAHIN